MYTLSNGCENSQSVSESSLCTVKIKHSAGGMATKMHVWVDEDFKYEVMQAQCVVSVIKHTRHLTLDVSQYWSHKMMETAGDDCGGNLDSHWPKSHLVKVSKLTFWWVTAQFGQRMRVMHFFFHEGEREVKFEKFTCPGMTSLGTEFMPKVRGSLDCTHQPCNITSTPPVQRATQQTPNSVMPYKNAWPPTVRALYDSHQV